MNKKRTGNNKFLKEYNQTGILELIRVKKSLSKADLSEITGLSPTAIGMITSELLENGYIHETGVGESKGGRRPVLLELKPHSYYSIGVDIEVQSINFIVMDITGEVVCEDCVNMQFNTDFENVADMVEDKIYKLLEQYSITADKLVGIGFSVAGLVNSESGEILLAPNLGWESINVKAFLNKLRDIPVYVENEAMASAICENWIGSCQDISNFVCINIRSGIGAGIFTNGRLYRGANGSAGEVGHVVVDENGPKCGCGNYGCLETMASTSRIVENARKLVRQGVASSLNTFEDVDEINIEDIIRAARGGDDASRNILNESARYLGLAISNMVNTLNPSKIVIGKEFVKYADLVMEQIQSIVSCKAMKVPASKVEITASGIGERASTLGAAIIPLKTLFGK